MLKQARNREMSKLPEVSQVTIFSCLKRSLIRATPSLLWLLPLFNHRMYSWIYTIFKIVKIILNYNVVIESSYEVAFV